MESEASSQTNSWNLYGEPTSILVYLISVIISSLCAFAHCMVSFSPLIFLDSFYDWSRRERNRMHAKMTRDRKKSFIAAIEKTIVELESSNKRMNVVLEEVICSQKSSTHTDLLTSSSENNKSISNDYQVFHPTGVSPISSPAMIPKDARGNPVPELMPALALSSSKKSAIHTVMAPMEQSHQKNHDPSVKELHLPPKKRVRHGFSLPF